ncbi:hypothetical protein B0H10DRAFT_2207118 [Mycena sp. CBHHK59/15]|nr:hypothetical protein B0H10DRAFT_2207118 [Mycena sp. CBHHK59/15]
MASSSASQPQAITLHFQNVGRVAGETLEGHVDLNVALAQEDHIEHLRIKLRGSIVTTITTSNGQTTVTHKQTILLIHSNKSLWTQGSTFPEPGSHVLSCPFQFQLPENLPPSFHGSAYHRRAAISYSLEVVGDRPGLFRLNRRIRRLISVLPAASRSQLLAAESLRQGWTGEWHDIVRDEKLRQGIWGDYSHAKVTLTIPKTRAFPVATPIPFTLHVVTQTKPLPRSDRPEDKHGMPLFPAPPAMSSNVKLQLRRDTELRVRGRVRRVEDVFDLRGSLGDVTRVAAVRMVVDEPTWAPQDTKDRGIWTRAVHFESALALPYAPTYSTETVDWKYTLRIVVPFPGLGNDLKLELPVWLDPAAACPPPPIGVAGGACLTYADVLPAGPPPMQDLPPSYWAGEDHDWDDEKS